MSIICLTLSEYGDNHVWRKKSFIDYRHVLYYKYSEYIQRPKQEHKLQLFRFLK